MKKILVIEPDPKSAIAYYRSIHPLQSLYNNTWTLDIGRSIEWYTISSANLIYMQRPHTEQDLEIVLASRAHKKPVVIDYDDYMFGIGPDNRAYHAYQEKSRRDRMTKIMELASLITVSTEHLKSLLSKMVKTRIEVVPNALDTSIYKMDRDNERTRSVFWRGSETHAKDLYIVKDSLSRLISKYESKDINFVFVGYSPFYFENHKNVVYHKPLIPFVAYMDFLIHHKPAVMFHTFGGSDFNKSKSMCSWLEATAAGACFVGPDSEEYNRPGIVQHKIDCEDSFYAAMTATIEHVLSGGNEPWRNSASYISENLTLDKMTKLRHDLYTGLT